MRLLSKIVTYSRMIKFAHTIFALPFALASVALVHRVSPLDIRTVFWIIMAMVGARSAAMGFNRLADASIDAKNPRTTQREIPAGIISRKESAVFVFLSALLFIVSSAMLSTLCLWLSFPVLLLLLLYSFTKRFTPFTHLVLGFCIGMVPMAVWVAVTGTLSAKIAVLCVALLTYIAGFDILYACQDAEFDCREGLYSLPSALGIKKALLISTCLHCLSVLSLLSLYWLFSLSPLYLIFVGIIAVLFIIEHRLVNPSDLTKVNIAFFHVNSVISILVFIGILSGEFLP